MTAVHILVIFVNAIKLTSEIENIGNYVPAGTIYRWHGGFTTLRSGDGIKRKDLCGPEGRWGLVIEKGNGYLYIYISPFRSEERKMLVEVNDAETD